MRSIKAAARKLMGLLSSTHPIPSLAVSGLTVVFGIALLVPLIPLSLVAISVLAQQFSVGLSNDWLDYERDKKARRNDKPTARGEVAVSLVRNSSFAAAAVALAVAASLGWQNLFMMFLMLAVGWVYNLGAKATGFSVLPYVIGFGILPIYVTLSLDPPQMPIWWLMLAASLLGVSAHFANALPDLLADKKTGVNALPHILGQKLSALVIAVAAVTASLLVITQSTSLSPALAIVGFALTVGLSLTASILALRSNPPRVIFYLLIGASFLIVVLLVLS